jgi:PKD repeat protein
MAFLFEPYNAYQKPPKKKHWMEIAEEEALLHRVQLEEQAQRQAQQQELFQEALKQHLALREANAKANQTNLNNQNVALPQHAPQPASQQVQNGQYAAPAGGGGWVLPSDLESQEVARFSALPSTGVGPLTVTFTNLTISPNNDTFLWNLGSSSYTSSAAITPPPLTYTQTGSYIVSLQETSSTGNKSITTQTITVTDPALYAWVSLADQNVRGPYSASVTVTHTYNGNGTVTGYFHFGDATPSVAYVSGAVITHIYDTGSWTASLALTESSYNHHGAAQIYISASGPVLTPSFSVSPATSTAPYTASFTYLGSAQVGNTTYGYRYVFADGTTSTSTNPTNVYQTGSWLVYMTMTESYYKTTAVYILPGGITGSVPIITALFTLTTQSRVAPSTASFSNQSSATLGVGDDLTYRWVLGDGTEVNTPSCPPHVYNSGSFVVRLNMTESLYNLTTTYSYVGGITESAPSLTPSFTVDVNTGTAPLLVTFTNTSTQIVNVNDSFNNRWVFGDGATTTTYSPTHTYAVGEWPVRLEMTESYYNITASYLLPGGVTGSA